uniref:Uncharacterized protein n=1 Tax=Setaria viridis TaxID=4556 RepID=A0A4U6V284_SETVI|nr:hypothetical protein SEVIR_4G229701v2 [Setaria viridis]
MAATSSTVGGAGRARRRTTGHLLDGLGRRGKAGGGARRGGAGGGDARRVERRTTGQRLARKVCGHSEGGWLRERRRLRGVEAGTAVAALGRREAGGAEVSSETVGFSRVRKEEIAILGLDWYKRNLGYC